MGQGHDSRLSLLYFLRVMRIVSLTFGVVVGLIAGQVKGWDDIAARVFGGGLVGFLVSGLIYLILVRRQLRSLTLQTPENSPREEILLCSLGSVVYFPCGRPLLFWKAIGGKLFVTDRALVFQSHGGQVKDCQLRLSFGDIECVHSFLVLGFFNGGVRITRTDGTSEVLSVGLLGRPKDWVKLISNLAEIWHFREEENNNLSATRELPR